jgi:hypothetical protein
MGDGQARLHSLDQLAQHTQEESDEIAQVQGITGKNEQQEDILTGPLWSLVDRETRFVSYTNPTREVWCFHQKY